MFTILYEASNWSLHDPECINCILILYLYSLGKNKLISYLISKLKDNFCATLVFILETVVCCQISIDIWCETLYKDAISQPTVSQLLFSA